MINKIKKRDGRIVNFEKERIVNAIFNSAKSVGGQDYELAKRLGDEVVKLLKQKLDPEEIPTVEKIQDIVEKILVENGHYKTAKAYILYRKQHEEIRRTKDLFSNIENIEKYLNMEDWRVKENANMSYSLQGLNFYISSTITNQYWLNKVYPAEIKQAHLNGDFHIHDLGIFGAYCVGWDLQDLLLSGFKGARGKIESKPPKHFKSSLGQIVNFLYTLQGESAGAQAFSNFDTLLAPFIRHDNLSYRQVKQAIQEFLFNINVPTRVGFQTPFTNITMDLTVPGYLINEPVIIGGETKEDTYSDYTKEMSMINRAFAEVMQEGDAKGRPFTFPIPTYNITKDFDWENKNYDKIFEMTAKYGIPYFANFINSDMKPDDVRSMCCRMRIDNRSLQKKGGGLFGANPLTGSIGVVTINMPRLGFLSKTKEEFFEKLEKLMLLARNSLEIKRKTLENLTEKGLYPYSKFYLRDIKKRFGNYWKNHFSTIGLVGMNECCLNFLECTIGDKGGLKFAEEVMDSMKNKLVNFQEETGNNYNLEATPAEGTSYRLARMDKKKFPRSIVANNEEVKKSVEPYYTNSTQLPVNFTNDIFESLKLQDPLQIKYTGGCIEKGNKVLTDKGLLNIEYIVNNFEKLKPVNTVSYNPEKKISEWDKITKAVSVNVKKHNKIRIKGERKLDITTSDWHPFFVLEKIKVNPTCPVCRKKVGNIKGFATHLRYSLDCRKKYKAMPKYQVIEKRADELKKGDYILQNSYNLFPNKETKLNNDLTWLIGFFIGDGSFSKFIDNRGGNNLEKYRVMFFSEHQEPLERIAKILNSYFDCKVKVIKNEKRGNQLLREVSTSKKEVSEFFLNYGFKPGSKRYNISVPFQVKKNINKNNIYALLSGLIDSDGHIDNQGDFEYYTVSSQLAENILEICSQAGIMISKKEKYTKRKNEVNLYRLRIPKYQITRIKDKLTNIVNPSKIRKGLSNRKERHLPVVRIKEVSKTEVEDNQFYDLTTEKNHNYLAGKNTLVFIHNTVLHIFLGEKKPPAESIKTLIRKICENFSSPYFTITPTFSICPIHGYIFGEHNYCPKCETEKKKTKCEVYSRIVGYLRPVDQWNEGKQEEFKQRKTFDKVLK